MTDVLYGFDAASVVTDSLGTVQPGRSGQVWTSYTGGVVFTGTKLVLANLTAGGSSAGSVVTDTKGRPAFFATDSVETLWLDFGDGSRWPVNPTRASDIVMQKVAEFGEPLVNLVDANTDLIEINTDLINDAIASTTEAVSIATETADLALATARTKTNPYVEGVPLYSYGHSYTMYPSPYTTPETGEYMERVRKRLNMGKGYFRGRSGTPLQDTIPAMLSPTLAPAEAGYVIQGQTGQAGVSKRQWVPNSRGIVLWQNFMNECSGADGGNTLYRNQWKHALRTGLALMSSSAVLSVEDAVRTGTWTKLVTGGNYWWNDTVYFSSTVNNTVTFSVTGDTCWIVIANSDAGYNTGTVEAKVGSTVLRTVVTQGQMSSLTSTLPGAALRTYNGTAYKITGMNAAAGGSAGAKNLVLRVTEAKNTFVSAVIIPSATPPHIFYGLEPLRNPAATTGGATFVANNPFFRTAATEVVAEFPNAHIVDLDEGWDNATMVGTLDTTHNFHPGDRGMIHICDRFVEAINATITQPINGVMTT